MLSFFAWTGSATGRSQYNEEKPYPYLFFRKADYAKRSQLAENRCFSVYCVSACNSVIRIDRSNPAVYSDLDADPSVQSILRKSCYDCHSNETVWPWYSGLAPVSWLVGNDVKEGRRHLNFSEWSTLDERTRLHKKQEIGEEVKAGRMPPWYYLLMHSGSRLKPSEQDLITAWTSSAAEAGAR
jgi:hypothetical protein